MSNAIRTYRLKHALTLEGFASLVGVKKAVVWKWENGFPPSPQSALAIAKATRGSDGAISLSAIRPDLWGNSTTVAERAS